MSRVTAMVVVVAMAATAAAQKEKKDDFRDAVKQWTGVIKDAKLKAAKPADVITDAETFEKLWKAWQPKADLPKVDFATQFVVVVASSYEPEYLSLYGGPKWNQSNSNKSPKEIKDGFGWGIGVFDRKGVEEVNGKKLPAPAKGEK